MHVDRETIQRPALHIGQPIQGSEAAVASPNWDNRSEEYIYM